MRKIEDETLLHIIKNHEKKLSLNMTDFLDLSYLDLSNKDLIIVI